MSRNKAKLYHVFEQEFVGRQSGHYRRGHTLFYSMMSSTDGHPNSHVASRMVSALFPKTHLATLCLCNLWRQISHASEELCSI